MGEFQCHILAAPGGFRHGCKLLNILAASEEDRIVLRNMMAEVMHVVSEVHDNDPSASFENELKQQRDIDNGRQTLKYLIDPIIQQSLTNDVYRQAIMLNTVLCDAFLEAFVGNLESLRNEQTVTTSPSSGTIGQLTNFHWTAGVAVKSNQTSRLMVPYVRMKFDVSQNAGAGQALSKSSDVASQVQSMSVEVTLKEYQEFMANLRKMQAIMDRL